MNILMGHKNGLRQICFVFYIMLCVFSLQVKSQDKADTTSGLFHMSLEELMDTEVKIATKSVQKISETPSIVSVFTAEDIKNMGARELADILRMVPGFEMTRNQNYLYALGVRGVKNPRFTTKILVLVDGIPFNHIFSGTAFYYGQSFNMDAIKRIEIIRGPGSALYGRNAFSAVISIITKNGEGQDGVNINGTVGNKETLAGSISYGIHNDQISSYMSFNRYTKTNSSPSFINADGIIQKMVVEHDNYTFNGNISHNNFSINSLISRINTNGDPVGSGLYNKVGQEYTYFSLKYNKTFTKNINLTSTLYSYNEGYFEDLEELKSKVLPQYPNGIYYKPMRKEYTYGTEIEINLKLFNENNLLFGLQADKHRVYDVLIDATIDFSTGNAISGATRGNPARYQPGWFDKGEHDYYNIALYIQDMWYPTEVLGITAGGRFDYDSEIGSVFNPRMGLVYKPFTNSSLKLLYGRAYRAPAPSEQYQTLGFAFGNPELKPEIINTFEAALNFRTRKINSQVSYYYNTLKDMIYAEVLREVAPGNSYYNIGSNKSSGIEIETKFIIGKSLYTFFNYSYVESKNTKQVRETDTTYNYTFNHIDISPHMANMGVNYSFLKRINLNVTAFYRSTKEKYTTQDENGTLIPVSQNSTGDYIIFNSNIRVLNIFKTLECSFSVHNILDTKYYSQTSIDKYLASQNGRHFNIKASYIF